MLQIRDFPATLWGARFGHAARRHVSRDDQLFRGHDAIRYLCELSHVAVLLDVENRPLHNPTSRFGSDSDSIGSTSLPPSVVVAL